MRIEMDTNSFTFAFFKYFSHRKHLLTSCTNKTNSYPSPGKRIFAINLRYVYYTFGASTVIDDFQFDLLGITELWLSPKISSHLFDITGYSIHRCDRPMGMDHGVVLCVKDRIYFALVYLHNVNYYIEYLSGVVHLTVLNFLTCIAYRPPHTQPRAP